MGEIHLIVVWQNATEKLAAILADISLNFIVKNVCEIIWSEDQFSKNLTRLYGQNLPSGCDKQAHIGIGPFHAIVFLDPAPKYGVRETTKGALSVNTNVFDARQKYREWTGGGHRIHATNSPLESLHDIWLIFGRDPGEFVEGKDWNGCIDSLSTDLLGAGGWQNFDVFFSTLNRLCNYIVMRNFESLPKNYNLNSHGDIDLLVEDLEQCVHVSGAIKAFPGDHRVQYYVKIAGEMVPFDFRYVGDSYYDRNFQSNLLVNREFVRNGFYAPNPVDYFYSLLYHALIHKPVFSEDYAERLRKLAAEIAMDFDGTPSRGARLLAAYFYENDYEYVHPNDSTVFFNERWVNAFNHLRSSEPRIAEILDETNDVSTFSLELRRHCTDWASFYYLSSARPNILRPFESWLHGNILEIGSNGGAITRYLGECGGNIVALEGSPRRAAMAKSRTRDLPNVNVVAGNIDEFQCDEQFDVIIMIGVLEYTDLFTRHDNPTLWMLQRVKSLLKPNGKLIVATENQLGLRYFAGVPENHLGKPMYGVEGRYQTDQSQTFGKATLVRMFKDAGFGTTEFLAPFPDYKLPVSIVTEAGFSCEKFDAGALAWQSVRRDPQLPPVLAFSPELVWPSVIQNGVGLDFANSFLIVAGTSENQEMDPSILAWHFTSERYKEFCKETRFVRTDNGAIEVQYHPLGRGSTKQNHGRLLKFFIPEKAEYAQGRPLSQELIQIVTRDGWRMEEVGAFLKHYLHILESIPSSRGIPLQIDSNDTPLPGELFDVLPQNIIVDNDGGWQIIDNEWTLNEDICAGWLIFRSLLPLFQTVTRFGNTASDFVNTPLGFFRAAFNAIDFAVTDVEIERCAKLELEVQTEVVRRPLKYDEFLNWLQTTPLPRQNLNQALAERDDRIIHLTKAKVEHERQISSLNQAVAEQKYIIEDRLSGLYSRLLIKEGELREVTALLELFQEERRELRRQLDGIYSSLMWRIMNRVRRLRDRLCPDGSRCGRLYESFVRWLKKPDCEKARVERSNGSLLDRILNIAKIILPVSPNRKYQLGSLLFKRFGSVFQHTESYQRWREQQPPLSQHHFTFNPSLQNIPHKPLSLVQLDPDSGVDSLVRTFKFPSVAQPLVSIVIPVYNHLEYTVGCLASLLKHDSQSSFEVIIVDDASNDGTPTILPNIENIRYWRNDTNLGFLRSSNTGAALGRGQFLLFLNNDTQVLEGWLDELVNTFRQYSDVGLVGSKLIYPNGVLQEAGAIIKSDGSAELVGLNADSDRPEYNMVREVDYCSGACLLIEAGFFKTLGGFDETYSPCYCEDSDLALRVRKMGKRVLYQPRSVVVHHLSVSINNSKHSKTALVTRNTDIFLKRWSHELKKLNEVRAIAFYLPQYHPIPENDHWWGKGFTEWTNVTKARPNFEGHYQPHLPADLGFYDLRVPEVREEQARLARHYGISAFCYYYYWFAGKKLLNRPFDEVLQSGSPDFPFCICWANENWTRRWDGREEEILIAQSHTEEDQAGFIASIAHALRDARYVRIHGKPLVIVYRLGLMPEPKRTADLWREYCVNKGIGEIYLAYVQSFERMPMGEDPGVYGFDAAIEFPPHRYPARAESSPSLVNPEYQGVLFDYVHTSENFINRPWPFYKLFRTVMPSWDNTPRQQDGSHVFINATPKQYEYWLRKIVDQTRRLHFGDERLVFINAWNEWAEGNHLEPDKQFGHQYLMATKQALGYM